AYATLRPSLPGPRVLQIVGTHPSLRTGARVDRVGVRQRRDVHRVTDDNQAALEAQRLGNLKPSHFRKGSNVLRVDLRERCEAGGFIAAVISPPSGIGFLAAHVLGP